ncbi:hypothetical protein [Chromobacterium vaccinii]|uniref:hypothetical protein n=1 Tax=Chromobacterium vaccinii TaxID=1108595 RepID=UPI001F4827EE|nr:hypothetical protein [Chromobacterium vaccinii]
MLAEPRGRIIPPPATRAACRQRLRRLWSGVAFAAAMVLIAAVMAAKQFSEMTHCLSPFDVDSAMKTPVAARGSRAWLLHSPFPALQAMSNPIAAPWERPVKRNAGAGGGKSLLIPRAASLIKQLTRTIHFE